MVVTGFAFKGLLLIEQFAPRQSGKVLLTLRRHPFVRLGLNPLSPKL